MRRIRLHRLLCVILSCILSIATLVACNAQAPTPPPSAGPDGGGGHTCSQPCPVCGDCLDEDCAEPECSEKCDGNHSSDGHTCSQPCPVCGKCTDSACDKTECYPKCDGNHQPDEHTCSQPCPVCGECTDTDCDKTECYPKCDGDHSTGEHNNAMPVVRITTADGSNAFATEPDRDAKLRDEIEYVAATVTIEDGAEVVINAVDASVKARGNYTLEYEKKPIRIKFDKKQSVLGLNGGAKFKNWVLLADWKDLSMSNNATALYLGSAILGADGYYCSDFRNVELYLNGKYWGVYLLVEQQEAKGEDGRSSAPAVPDDYTGTDVGYFVEYDGYYTDERNMPNGAGDPTFELSYNNYAALATLYGTVVDTRYVQCGYTVKSDIYSNAQLEFINAFMDNAYTIAYEAAYNGVYCKFSSDFSGLEYATGGTAQSVISAVIDVQSLADMYILSEIACDPDLAWSSFFISLDMTQTGTKKLIFEAPWDFDSAFGIKYGFVNSGNGMYAANCDNPWLILLIRQQWFRDIVAQKWRELVNDGVPATALELIDTYKTDYAQCYAKNFTRWASRITDGNGELVAELNTYTTQAQAADYLYDWLRKRFAYLDSQWGDGFGNAASAVPAQPEAGSTQYRFEAEDCSWDYGIAVSDWHSELASGGTFLGEIDGKYGVSVTLTVYAEEACTAFLSVGLSKRGFAAVFSEWFAVRVNAALLDVPTRIIPACSGGDIEWVAWTDVGLMPIELGAGINTITFTTVDTTATNIDYFELWAFTPIMPA